MFELSNLIKKYKDYNLKSIIHIYIYIMDFNEKYLKYKNKYLKLKNSQKGGDPLAELEAKLRLTRDNIKLEIERWGNIVENINKRKSHWDESDLRLKAVWDEGYIKLLAEEKQILEDIEKIRKLLYPQEGLPSHPQEGLPSHHQEGLPSNPPEGLPVTIIINLRFLSLSTGELKAVYPKYKKLVVSENYTGRMIKEKIFEGNSRFNIEKLSLIKNGFMIFDDIIPNLIDGDEVNVLIFQK